MNKKSKKIIVILGPTSSGKSDIAIKLAKKFSGEIISADSRQIYRGMDTGTGKITKSEQRMAKHYMIDIISPKTDFAAAQFKKKAEKIIIDILKRNKLPIICGGTGFWIKSLVDNINHPKVAPNKVLRKKLSNKSTEELFKILKKLDPVRSKNIDAKNPIRLIRAIEICKELGKVPTTPPATSPFKEEGWGGVKFLQIGIYLPKEKLHEKIKSRLKKRFITGMIAEVEKLHTKNKLSWKKIESFGLGYKLIPRYLKGAIENKEELLEKVYLAEKNYAKRQMTWFKKDKRIKWLKNYKEIEREVEKFLY